MKNQIPDFFNLAISFFVGLFGGYAITEVRHFILSPDQYISQSAPWYSSILLYGAITLGVVFIMFLLKAFFRKQHKQ